MISCTEFIPAYSVLFEYLDRKGGHVEVEKYWNYVSENYVEPNLGPMVKEGGIMGCWKYFGGAHKTEAADVKYMIDPENGVMTIDMKRCPSKRMLLELQQMEPYYDYCGHCKVIYKSVLEKYGIEETRDHSHIDIAQCFRIFRDTKLRKEEDGVDEELKCE